MKLIDKLKNALFEEEYVEVEEKPKAKPKLKPIIKEHKHEEKPIAKKIIPPEHKEVKITDSNTSHDDLELDNSEGEILADDNLSKTEFKFPLVSDNEFEVEEQKEEIREVPRKQELKVNKFQKEREEYGFSEEKKSKPYGLETDAMPEPTYGTYEKKEEKTYFKPSPIISPIYGILDKNYTKEDIIPKREVRLTSSYARENLDVDEVRNKAYGTLADDILPSTTNDSNIEEESNFKDNDLLDLSTDNDKPEVKKVTMGDAEEYFQDLGLEYNVDYKDASKEKATGRRYQEEIKEESKEPLVKDIEIKEEIKIHEQYPEEKEEPKVIEEIKNTESVKPVQNTDDDNLFDLIDSMYDKE